jgi:hypothetical protein
VIQGPRHRYSGPDLHVGRLSDRSQYGVGDVAVPRRLDESVRAHRVFRARGVAVLFEASRSSHSLLAR